MKARQFLALALISVTLFAPANGSAGPVTSTARDVAEYIFFKFGKGAAGNTVDDITGAATKAIERYGAGAGPNPDNLRNFAGKPE